MRHYAPFSCVQRSILYTDETRQQVKNRHAAGLSIRKIAAELGMSPTTVAKLLHE